MKVRCDVVDMSKTRRAREDRVQGSALTIRRVHPAATGDDSYECEIAGSTERVMNWLKRNKYEEGEYTVVEE